MTNGIIRVATTSTIVTPPAIAFDAMALWLATVEVPLTRVAMAAAADAAAGAATEVPAATHATIPDETADAEDTVATIEYIAILCITSLGGRK